VFVHAWCTVLAYLYMFACMLSVNVVPRLLRVDGEQPEDTENQVRDEPKQLCFG